MEKIIWFDCVRKNEELLCRIKGDTYILHAMKSRKANWIVIIIIIIIFITCNW